MELITMNAICNSAAPMGLNIGWDADMTQGFRSASPHCTPAYTQTSPNGLLTTRDTIASPNGLLTPQPPPIEESPIGATRA